MEAPSGLIRVIAPREGLVEALHVEEGDHVAEGQSLARLQDQQARLTLDVATAEIADRRAQLDVATAKAQGAQREAERVARLSKADAATRQDAEQAATTAAIAQGERHQAAAALRAAQAKGKSEAYEIEVRDVRAPRSGRIVRRLTSSGAFVSAAAPIFVIEPDGRRIIRAELDEAFADRVRAGASATVTREFEPGRAYKAQVLRVSDLLEGPSPSEDGVSKADARVVVVILTLPAAADLRLGQRVLVRFAP